MHTDTMLSSMRPSACAHKYRQALVSAVKHETLSTEEWCHFPSDIWSVYLLK
jgi:hypothetical protein